MLKFSTRVVCCIIIYLLYTNLQLRFCFLEFVYGNKYKHTRRLEFDLSSFQSCSNSSVKQSPVSQKRRELWNSWLLHHPSISRSLTAYLWSKCFIGASIYGWEILYISLYYYCSTALIERNISFEAAWHFVSWSDLTTGQ